MTSSSNTPPVPPPVVDNDETTRTGLRNQMLSTPPCARDHGEDTERHAALDDELTCRFLRRCGLAKEGPLDSVPSDELGFDRPLFVPPALPPLPWTAANTRDTSHLSRYNRLITTSNSGSHGGNAPRELFDPAGPGLAFSPETSEAEILIEEPTPPPLIRPRIPIRATQPPGGASFALPGRGRIWPAVAGGAISGAVLAGVLTWAVLQRSTLPEPGPATTPTVTPAKVRPPKANVSKVRDPRPPPAELPVLDLLARARREARQQRHDRAIELFSAVLTRDPDNSAAIEGQARSAVELGHAAALAPLERARNPALHRLLPTLRARLAVVRGEWRRADRLIGRLPRPLRYRPRAMVWIAQTWRGLGRLEQARYALQRVLRDRRLRDNHLRVDAMIHLCGVQLQRRRRTEALHLARDATALATRLGSSTLIARAEHQLARCQVALER